MKTELQFIDKSRTIDFDSWHEEQDAYEDWEGIVNYQHRAKVEYGMRYGKLYALFMHHDMWTLLRYYQYQTDRPYFTIKGKTECRRDDIDWMGNSNGCLHGFICDLNPKLKELVRFHLWEQDGLPFHYIENTVNIYKIHRRWTNSIYGNEDINTAWQMICQNVLLGENEKLPFIETVKEIHLLEKWLEKRKPFLQKEFHETMKRWGIEYISDKEIADLPSQVDAE